MSSALLRAPGSRSGVPRRTHERARCHSVRWPLAVMLAITTRAAHAQERPDPLRRTTPSLTDSAIHAMDARPAASVAAATGDTTLDALIVDGLSRSPMVRATLDRVSAARARIRPAGSRADPNLIAGLIQIPIAKPSLTDDNFTMLMVGVGQLFPYPGKLALRARAATLDADAVRTGVETARLGVIRAVKDAYYEAAYLGQALEIADRNRLVLADVVRVTEARYGTGAGGQQDVLRARVEAARLAETASMLGEARRAVIAQLNAALDRPTETPLERAAIPERIAHAAVAADVARIRFATATFGARAADSPVPSVAVLEERAVRYNPTLREHEARIAAQAARVELARKEYKPDFDVSVQYNHRVAFPDLATVQVAFPLRLQKSARQDQAVAEATADLSALEAEHRADVNEVRSRVAMLVSDLERNRTLLALYVKAILPQSHAGVTSALASYQAGRSDLLTLLDLQNTVFTYETAYFRALSDFAKKLAELEQVVGAEVLP